MDPLNPRGAAPSTAYVPANPDDWSPAPPNVAAALDQLAANPPSGEASTTAYSPVTPGDWSPVPTEVATALDELAARPIGGSGGTQYVYVYRDSEPHPSGNVYATFATAYAARQAVQGQGVIEFDTSLNPGTIPAGTYDFTDTILTGRITDSGVLDRVTVAPSGVTITHMPDVRNLEILYAGSSPAFVENGGNFVITLTGVQLPNTAGFFAVVNSGYLIINAINTAVNSVGTFIIDGTSEIVVTFTGPNAYVGANLFVGDGPGGTGLARIQTDGLSWSGNSQTSGGFPSGNYVLAFLENAPTVTYSPAVPGNWSPAPIEAAGALDQLAARPQVVVNLASAWADDGGVGVTFDSAGEIGATATITPTSTGLLRVTVTASIYDTSGSSNIFFAGISIGTGIIPFTYPEPGVSPGWAIFLSANASGTATFVVDLDRIGTPIVAPVGSPFVVNMVGKSAGTSSIVAPSNIQVAIQERAS